MAKGVTTATATGVILLLNFFLLAVLLNAQYLPTWESLDKHPHPKWFDEAKIGVFVHWGVYSVPSFGTENSLGEWFWWEWKGNKKSAYVNFMKKNYPPDFQYQDFAPQFKAELFDPNEWLDILQASGAKYFIITSKHHEGFTLWKSNVSWNWNSVDAGPHRDLLADLSTTIRSKSKIRFCLYHSLFEWFHPLYLKDKANGFKTQEYIKTVLMPELHDVVNRYKPHYIWSDGDWEAGSDYWNSKEFIAWLYNESPVKDDILVNDRWGKDVNCKHGDVKTCGRDRFNPGHLLNFKWENDMTIDLHSWGWRRNAVLSDYLTMDKLTDILAQTMSCGGNMVMNIGPTASGRISPIFEERLRQMGSWLKVNGEAVYASKPWRAQNDTVTPNIWYTTKANASYAFVLNWPQGELLSLGVPVTNKSTKVTMLGLLQPLEWSPMKSGKGLTVSFKEISVHELPCKWAWVLKLENVS